MHTSIWFACFMFNGDAVNSIELNKGRLSCSDMRGRLSSVLDMKMKEGQQGRFKGEVWSRILSF